LKKLAADESALLKLLNRWREEAEKAGGKIERIAVAFEAGWDGFWLARWLRGRGIGGRSVSPSLKRCWPSPTRSFKTPGVHRGARQRGSVVGGGAGAAAGNASDWVPQLPIR
jgi:hypothetical protein